MPKQVYQINPQTGEYIGTTTAYENPMVKRDGIPFNIPASCVEEAPPPPKEGFAIVHEGNVWTYIVDNRGKTIYTTADKTPQIVSFLGSVPDGFTLLEPGPFSVWKKTKWVDDAEAVIAAKKEENNAPLKVALVDIDIKSIRALREWVLSQPDAPSFLKDHEKAAAPLREKLL